MTLNNSEGNQPPIDEADPTPNESPQILTPVLRLFDGKIPDSVFYSQLETLRSGFAINTDSIETSTNEIDKSIHHAFTTKNDLAWRINLFANPNALPIEDNFPMPDDNQPFHGVDLTPLYEALAKAQRPHEQVGSNNIQHELVGYLFDENLEWWIRLFSPSLLENPKLTNYSEVDLGSPPVTRVRPDRVVIEPSQGAYLVDHYQDSISIRNKDRSTGKARQMRKTLGTFRSFFHELYNSETSSRIIPVLMRFAPQSDLTSVTVRPYIQQASSIVS